MGQIEKNILITGVSTGIGYESASALLAKGYRVYGTVRKQTDAEKLAQEWGRMFYPLVLDVTDNNAVQRAVGEVTEFLKGGGLDGLVNNAGVAQPGPLAIQPLEEIRHMMEVNFFGPLSFIRACLPLLGMRENPPGKPGKIINIS